MPHKPAQGSSHLRLMQALSWGQSLLIKHSGLQFGGRPIMPGWQLHSQRPFLAYGITELGPQGLGSQGSTTTGSIGRIAEKIQLSNNP